LAVLPMVVRLAIDGFVRDLVEREAVTGVGLLGGWPPSMRRQGVPSIF